MHTKNPRHPSKGTIGYQKGTFLGYKDTSSRGVSPYIDCEEHKCEAFCSSGNYY